MDTASSAVRKVLQLHLYNTNTNCMFLPYKQYNSIHKTK
jgi:hypothetical protein